MGNFFGNENHNETRTTNTFSSEKENTMENNMTYGWDGCITKSSRQFEDIPNGRYKFTVTNFERGYYDAKPGSRIPSCNQANLVFTIYWTNPQGQPRKSKIKYQIKLATQLQSKIIEFFESIGYRNIADGKTRMPWNEVVGKTGYCQIGHFKGKESGKIFACVEKCFPAESSADAKAESRDTAQKYEL